MSQALARRLNADRRQHGKAALADSRALRLSAKAKASYLAKSGVLAHRMWWKLIDRYTGRRFTRIGENIADGQDTRGPWLRPGWLLRSTGRTSSGTTPTLVRRGPAGTARSGGSRTTGRRSDERTAQAPQV